jgi:hypothetical protein
MHATHVAPGSCNVGRVHGGAALALLLRVLALPRCLKPGVVQHLFTTAAAGAEQLGTCFALLGATGLFFVTQIRGGCDVLW